MPDPVDSTERPRPLRIALGGLEDGRDARRVMATRILFLVGLFSWVSLAAWWATYFYRSSIAVRDATLRAYVAEEHVLVASGGDVTNTPFEVVPTPLSQDAVEFPFSLIVEGKLAGNAIVVRPEERQRLRTSLHRKMIMLAGEGSLLVGLAFTCLMALYRMLMAELRLRRQQESFVHSVTHELKSPLAGLRSLLQSLATLDIPKEDRGTYLDMGIGEIDRLDQLTANILLSSRLDAHVFKPAVMEVDIAAALARLRDKRARLFVERGGELTLEVSPHLIAQTDGEAVQMIFENLADNALKYTPGKPMLRVSGRSDGRRTFIDFTDNGIGLSGADTALIFNKFYRAPSGEQSKAKGSGLGLFIARGLARSLGGDITVCSAGPGQGTTFTVELPG